MNKKTRRKPQLSKSRQAMFRKRQADAGLIRLTPTISALLNRLFIKEAERQKLSKHELATLAIDTMLEQYDSPVAIPRATSGEEIGDRRIDIWVPTETFNNLKRKEERLDVRLLETVLFKYLEELRENTDEPHSSIPQPI